MYQPQLTVLQRRHGLTPAVIADFRVLLEVASAPAPVGGVTSAALETMAPWVAGRASDALPPPGAPRGERYEDLGPLGVGGMGVVRRVRDRVLNRPMAMKTLHPELLARPGLVSRFVEEAQATAQLQHPGIVPVHELGWLGDGRPYFTMQEVRGRTLGEVIAAVHEASGETWEVAPGGWSFRRLIDAFHRVCEAVAYAHDRGVIHRDLKPENVMLGEHGEVLVVDWGLAKVRGQPDRAAEAGALGLVVTDRSRDDAQATRLGQVSGTPAYMPPEQARGEIDRVDVRSDVYSLGAILYEILSGRAPYAGETVRSVLQQVLVSPPQPPGRATSSGVTSAWEPEETPLVSAASGSPLPASLVSICTQAMSRAPEDRFADAGALASEVAAWLDGARRREQALAVVEKAQQQASSAAGLRAEAVGRREEAAALLSAVKGWQPEEDKAPGWALEDEAAALEARAEKAEVAQEQLLAGALTHAPDLPEAHAALANCYRAEHTVREAARESTMRAEALLREHAGALPASHPDRSGHFAYLKGDGALTLMTDPSGAEVLLHRYTLRNRRLVPVFERNLGVTPIRAVSLARGSYLCVLRHPERADVRYPVHIGRQAHWDGVPPEGGEPHPVWLPPTGALDDGDCYVPTGWFVAGGDPKAPNALPRVRLWCDGLVFRRFPVTNAQYIAFLDDLVARGREDEALRHVPRERPVRVGEQGAMLYGYTEGRFRLVADAEGDVWHRDWPVMMVDWHGARAYAAWLASRTGRGWRLPGELEWEKAARGVDGRFYPWGDGFDPSWGCMENSHTGRRLPSGVESYPVDTSPYGVRGMAGNMSDWCADAWQRDLPLRDGDRLQGRTEGQEASSRVFRGGSLVFAASDLRASLRSRLDSSNRGVNLGFRLARSVRTGSTLDP